MERMICQCCGEALHKHGDGYECAYCGAHYRDDQAEKAAELLRSLLDEFKLEQLANARRRLYESTHEKYPSSQAVKQAAGSVLSISPEDFMARVYLHSHDSDPHALISVLARERVSEWEAKEALNWLIRSLDSRTVGAVKDFADRHLQGEDKTKALNEIEDEAFKLDSGVYDLSLKRDVFLCYSAADMPRVLETLELLEENGLSCFAAFRNLRHGKGAQENYQEAIFRAMKNCRVFVFLSSNSSRSPARKGVAEELDHLTSDFKQKPRVEYLLEDYPDHMPVLAKRRLEEAFPHLEYCRDDEDLVLRVSGLLNAEEDAEKERNRKIAEEAVAKAKQELQAEFEAREAARRAELEAERLRAEKETLELDQRRMEANASNAKPAPEKTENAEDVKKRKAKEGNDRRKAKAVELIIAAIDLENINSLSKGKIDNAKKAYGALTEEQKALVANYQNLLDAETLCGEIMAIDAEYQMEILRSGEARIVVYVGKGKAVTVPDRYGKHPVVAIAGGAFSGCSFLESITIPNSVTSIGYRAFYGCASLKSMALPFIGESATSNPHLGYIFGAGSYYQNASYVPSRLKSVFILEGCDSIAVSAFRDCSSLTSVTIPSGVTSIGSSAFYGCSSLESITIPNGVKSIGYRAFEGCTSLESMRLPFVGGSASADVFLGHIFGAGRYSENSTYVPLSLKSIAILEGCSSIGTRAFYGCSSLESIEIPNSVTSIGNLAFQGCSKKCTIYIACKKPLFGYPKGFDKNFLGSFGGKTNWGKMGPLGLIDDLHKYSH